ncbi:MAG: hypothetical protein WDM92_09855 [Caulobacteraceae bacterium]
MKITIAALAAAASLAALAPVGASAAPIRVAIGSHGAHVAVGGRYNWHGRRYGHRAQTCRMTHHRRVCSYRYW